MSAPLSRQTMEPLLPAIVLGLQTVRSPGCQVAYTIIGFAVASRFMDR
jgi:hypothetical protein